MKGAADTRRLLLRFAGLGVAGVVLALGVIGPGRLARSGEPFTSDGLIVSSRDGLSICVDLTAPGSPPSAVAIQRIHTALDQVAQHPSWQTAGYAKRPPIVTAGCPAASVIMAPEIERQGSSRKGVPRRRVDAASPYRVWIVVLPDQRVSDVFANVPPYLRSEPEEILCDPGAGADHPLCMAPSLGVYLSAAEFGDDLTLVRALTFGLNLGGLGARPSDPATDVPPGMVIAESREDALRKGQEKFGPLPSPTPWVPPTALPSPTPWVPPIPTFETVPATASPQP